MTARSEVADKRWVSATAIYGVISAAVVVVAWEPDGRESHLLELLGGYLLALWLTHAYARYVSAGVEGSWREALLHEFPVAAAGLPALAVAGLADLLGWDANVTSATDLLACGVTLVAMQLTVLRAAAPSRIRLVTTAVYDLAAAALVILLHVIVH